MKIYIFLAEGFEEIEAIAPIDIFRRAGIEVLTVSVSDSKIVTGAHAIPVVADCLFADAIINPEDMLFLPGGMPGTTNLEKHEGLRQLILEMSSKGAKLAAICAAPSIFGNLGMLEGLEAICYPGFENSLKGALLSDQKIVKSDNIFTAKAAGVAIEFALKLVADLQGEEAAESISKAIYL